jgi:hypothetical protein
MMQPLAGERVPVINKDYWTLSTEVNDKGYTFLHCDVHDWKPSTYKAMLLDYYDWLAEQSLKDGMIFFAVYKDNEKTCKFAEMFGFGHYIHYGEYIVYMMEVS